MKTLVDELQLGEHKLQLILGEGTPYIFYNGKVEAHLERLVQQFPELADPRHLLLFAKLANFLFGALRFELIEDIAAYRARYDRLYREDARVAAYGPFDLTPLALPTLQGDQAIIYVEEIASGLPYCLNVPFPYRDPSQPYAYKRLGYKSE